MRKSSTFPICTYRDRSDEVIRKLLFRIFAEQNQHNP